MEDKNIEKLVSGLTRALETNGQSFKTIDEKLNNIEQYISPGFLEFLQLKN